MRIALAALAVALVAAVGGGVTADASPEPGRTISRVEWSPNGRWLAFSVLSAARPPFVSAVRLDRKVQWRFTAPAGIYYLTVAGWSPDSRQLAVVGLDLTSGLPSTWIFSADGRQLQRLDGTFDDWSPDARAFLLTREDGLYVVDAQTGSLRVLVQGDGPGSLASADWSPNGRQIAFEAITRRTSCDSERRIFSVDVNGANKRQLGGDERPFSDQYIAAWAPDSARLAYYDNPSDDCLLDGISTLVLVRADGSRNTKELGAFRVFAGWSPGGRRFAIKARRGLIIMKEGGKRVATFPHVDGEVAWAPGGGSVVFDAAYSANQRGRIYTARADGTKRPRRVGTGTHPTWSKLGWIAFSSRASCAANGGAVYIARPDGTRLHALSRCRPKP